MVNNVTLIGRVGDVPKVRKVNEKAVARLSLATSETYKDGNGEKKETTEWHSVTVFGKLADIVERYVGKGSLLYAEGKLHYGSYKDRNGMTRNTVEIVAANIRILDSRKNTQDKGEETRGYVNSTRKVSENVPENDDSWTMYNNDLPY